jgi:hypothetical protein
VIRFSLRTLPTVRGETLQASPGQGMGDGVVASETHLVHVLDEMAGHVVVATDGGMGSIRDPTVSRSGR